MPAIIGFTGCCGAGILHGIQCAPSEKQIKTFAAAAAGNRWGIVHFIDNKVEMLLSGFNEKGQLVQDKAASNGGKRWAAMIREMGFRVDEHFLGGNPNHNQQHPHILTLYIWYLNKEGRNKESVYVGEQEERKPKPLFPDGKPGLPPGEGASIGLGGVYGAVLGLGSGIGF